MEGFFTRQELEKSTRIDSAALKDPNCLQCGLYKGCKHPKMEHTGEGRLKCLIIAEGPAKEEDATGIQLTGDVGRYFRGKISSIHNLDLDRDFYKINAVNCWPRNPNGTTRTPTKAEIEFCRPMVNKTITELQPEYIWLMGNAALQSFYAGEFKNLKPTRWRGLSIPDQKTNALILPLFHPSYPRRGKHIDQNIVSQYDRDLKNATDQFSINRERVSFDSCEIVCLYDFDAVISLLDKILQETPPFLFTDYETTGLKPYKAGHKILSMSLAFSPDKAYSFPMKYKTHWSTSEFIQIKKRVRKILNHPEIRKQAHNLKFEHMWSRELLGVSTEPWDWCSMNAAHILDNRRSFTGLKFQTYINFGILPYDKHIDKYKHSVGDTDFNRLEEVPLDELLEYGGYDSLYGINLANKQSTEIAEKGLFGAYELFHKGLIEFADIERTGICIDEETYEESEKEIITKIEVLNEKLSESPEVKKFEKSTNRPINLASNNDLGELIYDILGADKIRTGKGNYKTDEDALKRAGFPFTENLLHLKKLEKVLGTNLAQFKKHVIGGKLHPSFDLHIPITYRSSSSDPTFHTIPVRDAESEKYCRSGIVPSRGNKLLESDFKGIEVSTGTCYHKDPQMIKYNTDPKTDMHRDTAMDLWKLPLGEITGDIRFYAKNDWVFAEFYGDWYRSCAQNLWEDCKNLKTKSGVPLREHMRRLGIKSLGEFTEHCKDVERIFWDTRFKGYKKWKEDNNALYRKQGYLETLLGFIFSGPMSFNEVCNYQIQGTAFHLLLWTLIEIMKVAREEKWKSKIIGQIHDSMLNDCVPEEEEHIIKTINYIGTEKIREVFPWIIVPLSIDHEVSPVNGTWYDMGKETTARPSRRR